MDRDDFKAKRRDKQRNHDEYRAHSRGRERSPQGDSSQLQSFRTPEAACARAEERSREISNIVDLHTPLPDVKFKGWQSGLGS